LETLITKETLKSKLNAGVEPAIELLYTNYSPMLYGYILQFVPEQKEAEKVLVLVFGTLATRLQDAFGSPLSIYMWMQVEARKLILEYKKQRPVNGAQQNGGYNKNAYYLTLLRDASPEQRMVFSEIFLHGRSKDELAVQLQTNVHDINRLLNESLLIIRKNLQ
jgi:hypothetical protein